MWVAGRILLVILVVIGVILVVAGTASLVGADSWTDQMMDDINIRVGDGGVARGVILLAACIITNLRPTDFIGLEIGFSN